MKKLLFVGLAMLVLMPVVASAQSAFDGTWKIELNKADFSKKPTFTCYRMAHGDAKRVSHR